MAQTNGEQLSELDSKYAKARPWVRRFVEDYQDGRPWGYAIFQDPTLDEEALDECMCRIDNKLRYARGLVSSGSGDRDNLPPFKWEVLDWPEGEVDELAAKLDDGDAAAQQSEPEFTLEARERPTSADRQPLAEQQPEQNGSEDDSKDSVGVERAEIGAGEEQAEDGEISLGSDDTYSEQDDDDDEADRNSEKDEDSEEEDDADVETVRELNKLRAHFKWVRDRAKKRRLSPQPLDVDRSGIPKGLLRNVFLVIDQDVINSIVVNSPFADGAWIWAVDPDYTGKVASMTKNGLNDEYYGYMRVRLQQLVNNFWDARCYHEDELPLPMLWAAAKQSLNCAFVSMDPAEARAVSGSMLEGSALRAQTV